ncbi:hypothetical protein CDAR_68001 [Caerostris darwini]|uniref:Uncharacterized protein n=1 Tax=Caerostris darwini TaxID=1538125 RepID=A0AAV4VU01_9ARAC|nr:hypothetical protein CDAR_68001 [Caerostris darwini]
MQIRPGCTNSGTQTDREGGRTSQKEMGPEEENCEKTQTGGAHEYGNLKDICIYCPLYRSVIIKLLLAGIIMALCREFYCGQNIFMLPISNIAQDMDMTFGVLVHYVSKEFWAKHGTLFTDDRSSQAKRQETMGVVKSVFALKREPGLPIINECLTEQTRGEDIGHCFRKDIGRIPGNKTRG